MGWDAMRSYCRVRRLAGVVVLAGLFCGASLAADHAPVASWHFDEGTGHVAVDKASGTKDALAGHLSFGQGVRGSGLKFDGFTTRVVCKAANAPKLSAAITVEAWIAPQEYSWNWTGIVDQEKDHRAGFSLGIDHAGRVGLRVAVGGKWQGCLSKQPVPLLKWSHLVGTFVPSKGLTVYINGQIAGKRPAKGNLVAAPNTDLWIGMSHTRQYPELTERDPSKGYPSNMVFDGLIDEVKVYNRALSSNEIRQSFASVRLQDPRPLSYRKMPSGPKGLGRFGAFYTRLKYAPEWERIWRVGDHADVLVTFDTLPVRMVFWRGTGYCPAWVTDNDKWVGDQGPESWNKLGCCEQMADKQCRYAHVRIIESHDARSVVHWRTASPDISYGFNHVDPDTGWGEWTDEYYYVYPDAVAVRYQQIHGSWAAKMEWQQTELLNQPGTKPRDNVELHAITLVDLDGNTNTFSWEMKYGKRLAANKRVDGPVQVMNLKSKYRHFVIGEPGAYWKPLRFGARDGYSTMPCWNHWPVAQLPNDGRITPAPDRPSSTCLGTLYPIKHKTDRPDLMFGRNLYGMTDKRPEELVTLARSWSFPAELKLNCDGYASQGYDKNQRAYVFKLINTNRPANLTFTLAASENSPVLNPAFVIKGWGRANARLMLDGKPIHCGKDFRTGHRHTLEGTDLIVWIKLDTTRDTAFSLSSPD